MWMQIEDLTQSAQVAAAEKLKSSAKESSKASEQAAAAAALEPESESDEEVHLCDLFAVMLLLFYLCLCIFYVIKY